MTGPSVVLLGEGGLLRGCARALAEIGQPFTIVTPKARSFISLGDLTGQEGGNPPLSLSSGETWEYLRRAAKPLLVFSIVNTAIFPPDVVALDGLAIVNYHNAFLGRHRGRNCEAWQIWTREESAGVTWHFVDAGVDTGAVIKESPVRLDDDITSIQLLKKQADEALRMFREMAPRILANPFGSLPEANHRGIGQLHLSWEKPAGGELDPSWPAGRIWAFLRCMDYGPLFTLGHPSIAWRGERFTWHGYAKEGSWHDEDEANLRLKASEIVFAFPQGQIILKNRALH